MSKTFSKEDVASHNKPTDLLIIVNEDVYDVTQFQEDHPGGKKSEIMRTSLVISQYLTLFPSPPASRWKRCLHSVRKVPQSKCFGQVRQTQGRIIKHKGSGRTRTYSRTHPSNCPSTNSRAKR
jgi:cytochrome b5-like protein